MAASIIRPATLMDAEAILRIYNPYIENSCVTFEYKPLSISAFRQRMEQVMASFPWIVYETDRRLVGYAYASPYHTREAYSWNCDSSVYVDKAYQDQGIGTTLYQNLFLILKEMGYYNVYATVTSPNPVSLAFHQQLGFQVEGTHENTGWKFGRWLGVTRLVKKIGDFSKEPRPLKNIQELDIPALLNIYMS